MERPASAPKRDAPCKARYAGVAEWADWESPLAACDQSPTGAADGPERRFEISNPVVHFEIRSQDPAALREFYSSLFDWQIKVGEEIEYDMVTTRAKDDPVGIDGGLTGADGDPNMVTFYVQVDDIDASLQKAVDLGAKVIVPVMTIPKSVTFALFADPQGNCIGMVASQTPD